MIASGIAIVTVLLLANNALSPADGIIELPDTLMVYGLATSFTFFLDSTMFVRYSIIQFSMMPEITSFTFLYALSAPEMAPTTAPARAARIRQIAQLQCHAIAA